MESSFTSWEESFVYTLVKLISTWFQILDCICTYWAHIRAYWNILEYISTYFAVIEWSGFCLMAEIENVLRMIGFAATRLKGRLDMIYGSRLDDHGRRFIGLHESSMPLCSVARSIFQQLRGSTAKNLKFTNRLSLELLPRLVAGQKEGSLV